MSSNSASVSFTPPTDTGGAPVTSYTVTSTPGSITATGAASPIVVTGLTNGTSYTFTVHATNSAGNGPESAPSNAVTPQSDVPLPVNVPISLSSAISYVVYEPAIVNMPVSISSANSYLVYTTATVNVPITLQ